MAVRLDHRQVLAYLNELGYKNITAQQLKDFMHDLKKLIKYEKRYSEENVENIPPLFPYNESVPSAAHSAPSTRRKKGIVGVEIKSAPRTCCCSNQSEYRPQPSASYISTSNPSGAEAFGQKPNSAGRTCCCNRGEYKPQSQGSYVSTGNPSGAEGFSQKPNSAARTCACCSMGNPNGAEGFNQKPVARTCSFCDRNGYKPQSAGSYVSTSNLTDVEAARQRTSARQSRMMSREPSEVGSSRGPRSKSCEPIVSKSKTTIKLKGNKKSKASFILPRSPVRNFKSDPVALYHKYQRIWRMQNIPGESPHAQLRWAVRGHMLGQPSGVLSAASSTDVMYRRTRTR